MRAALLAAAAAATALRAGSACADAPRPGATMVAGDGEAEIRRDGAPLAIYLAPGESSHPALDPAALEIRWLGFLSVESDDAFSFRATVEGDFTFALAGYPAATLRSSAEGTASVETPAGGIRVKPGLLAFEAFLRRVGGRGAAPLRLALEWRSTQFGWEPVPVRALRPADEPVALTGLRAASERGRRLVDEAGCAGCHPVPRGSAIEALLSPRAAPDLTRAGSHARAEWIARWLEHPAAVRSSALMPRLFHPGAEGRRERRSIARFLAGLDAETREGPPPRVSGDRGRGIDDPVEGERLFWARGCVACHEPLGRLLERERPAVRLEGSGSQSTPAGWAHYLLDPLRHDASGRMPDLSLDPADARNLAAYLASSRDPSLEVSADEGDAAEGEGLLRERRCIACHPFKGMEAPEAGEKPLLALDLSLGCLADDRPPAAPGAAPRYDFGSGDRAAIRAFLSGAGPLRRPAAPAPIESARVAVERLRCAACHSLDGRDSELSRLLAAEGSEAPREAMQPPALDGAGTKLREDWLRKVLAEDGRARPWLSLRMPRFGAANVLPLVSGLLGREGIAPGEDDPRAAPRPEMVMAGRELLSPLRLSCTSCHDMAGVPGSGNRGPEVLRFAERLRKPWFERWMLAPQRLKPGTEMPTYFVRETSLVTEILSGDARAQVGALWDYLGLGMKAPLPDGLTAPSGIGLVPKGDRPLVVRTPLFDRARVVAVGWKSGISVGIEAGAEPGVRLFWDGGFLRLNGTQWTGQHGPYPEIEGRSLAALPDGFAWRLDGIAAAGPARFRGYRIDGSGDPSFHYELPLAHGAPPLRVEETLSEASAGGALGVSRRTRLEALPKDQSARGFLFADARARAVFAESGAPLGPGSRVAVSGSPFVEVLMDEGRRAIVSVRRAPEGSTFEVGPDASPSLSILVPPSRAGAPEVECWTLFCGAEDAAAARAALGGQNGR